MRSGSQLKTSATPVNLMEHTKLTLTILFLAMPLMAAIKSVCMHVEGWSAWGHLMSSEDMPIPEAPPELPKTPAESVATVVPTSQNENE